jgi:hypothetical protein
MKGDKGAVRCVSQLPAEMALRLKNWVHDDLVDEEGRLLLLLLPLDLKPAGSHVMAHCGLILLGRSEVQPEEAPLAQHCAIRPTC